ITVWLPTANGFDEPLPAVGAAGSSFDSPSGLGAAPPRLAGSAPPLRLAELPPMRPSSAPTAQSEMNSRSAGKVWPTSPSGPHSGRPDIGVHRPGVLRRRYFAAAGRFSQATSHGSATGPAGRRNGPSGCQVRVIIVPRPSFASLGDVYLGKCRRILAGLGDIFHDRRIGRFDRGG